MLVSFSDLDRKIAHVVVLVHEFWKQHGSKSGHVESEGDWKTIEFLYKAYVTIHPEDAKRFIETQRHIRTHLRNDKAVAREGDGLIRQTINVPTTLYRSINLYYPYQKFDKRFVHTLATRLPVLRVPKRL
jgi:hypothetical protein